eukprot:TRINITY_DN1775_c0_g1_i1.p1 TRINITY_DN1775_c0_g1~~TRINITY_DN1775_c0_g1_i1.p1  ORF type:complete len:603 (+),score=170.32 TRINITY_DN1775_c0_g1_i1:105-1913(+)
MARRPGGGGGVGAARAAAGGDVATERLQARWVPRDQLEEWHRTLSPGGYLRKVRGVAVRFLAADMTYKVGWVCAYEPQSLESGQGQPQDCLVVDAGQGANEVVLLRNVSNSKFKPEEVAPSILQKLREQDQQRMPSRVIQLGQPEAQVPPPILHPHVLMIGPDGEVQGPERISEVVASATGEDPDTPRAGAMQQAFAACMLPEQEMISRYGTGTAQMVQMLEQRSEASHEDERWLRNLIDMTGQLAEQGGRRGGGVSKPYFAQQVLQLCQHAERLLQQEPMLVRLRSPVYVFGDIHGNYDDLAYFLDKLIPFGEIRCAPGNLLFLGDYVDRGENGIECTVHLLALYCLARRKVTMLRGNHEAPEVNGDVAEYGGLSFKHECNKKFGEAKGDEVWMAVNRVFRLLPGAAVIDGKVFACHGGIPRYCGGPDDRLEILGSSDFPRLPQIQTADVGAEDTFTLRCRQIMEDLVWSDPAAPGEPMDQFGFGDNRRGPGLKTFGSKAVDEFLQRHGFSHIFRAHQEKSNGLRISDNGRVVTIFSTSDYVGHQNGAGVVFLGDGVIRMIIKKPPHATSPQVQQPPVQQHPPPVHRHVPQLSSPPGRRGR